MQPPTLTRTLRLDAAVNLIAAALVGLLAGALAGPAGLSAAWPLWPLAAGLALYGIENQLVSRRPTRPAVTALIAIDVVFAVAALAIALTNPTGAETWVRWVLFAAADLALVAGALKARSLSRPAQPPATRHHQPA